MPDNGKKEYPKNQLEKDCTSKVSRKVYCYVTNVRGIRKYVKRQMNKRFRKKQKVNKYEYNLDTYIT